MNITATAIAVTLAVIIAGALLFLGPNIFALLGGSQPAPANQTATTTSLTMPTSTPPDSNPAAAAGPTIPNPLPTTLTVNDETVGTGATAKAGDTVTVNYVGMLPDGTVFDASANHGNQGFSFKLGAGQVIAGWDQGVAGMKVGGKRQLIIPPDLGYGAQGAGNVIPPNATLIFQVELVSVGQ